MSDLPSVGGGGRSDESIVEALQDTLDKKQDKINSDNRIAASHIENGSVSSAEFLRLNSVTSNIQNQLNALSSMINAVPAATKKDYQKEVMIYPTSNPNWAFKTFTFDDYNLEFTLRDGQLQVLNNGSQTVYLTVERNNDDSTSSSYGTATVQAARIILSPAPTTRSVLTSFNASGYVSLKMVASAYGGEYKTPVFIEFRATRHDSDDVLCIIEAHTLVD